MAQSVPALLREIHRLRRFVRDLQGEIDRVPRVLKAHQQKVAKQEQALRDAQDGLKKLKAHVLEREGNLKSTHQQLAKYEKQRNEAASKKEYDALQAEIVHTEGARQKIEEEILAGMMESDERTAQLPQLEALLKSARDELAAYQKEMEARVAQLKDELGRAQADLTGVEVKIPAAIRSTFDRLIKAFGPDAFAAVEGRICQQCRTAITAQNENDLRGGQFITCKNCARGLYLIE